MTMDVGMYNNQQGGYSGDYYQQPYQGYEGYEGYYEPTTHYYEPAIGGPPLEHPPVINTDAGLCYTNLDYGELQSYHPLQHQEIYKHRDEPPRQDEPHIHDHKLDNHYLETKYNMHFVDESVQYGHGASPLPCGEFDPYQPKDEFVGLREGFPREAEMQHGLVHQPHPSHAVPTYKWMQVKRNVPKPSGE